MSSTQLQHRKGPVSSACPQPSPETASMGLLLDTELHTASVALSGPLVQDVSNQPTPGPSQQSLFVEEKHMCPP